MTRPALVHQFNGDLLVTGHDQKLAKDLYRDIYHVLDHPELRQKFQDYDDIANSSKLWVQRLGLLAILLASLALLGSAVTPLLHQEPEAPLWCHDLLFGLEVCGIVGVVIAASGIAIAKKKNCWLKARMLAEALRLWHFQSLVCRGKEIAMSCNPSDVAAAQDYRKARATAFQAFLSNWERAPDSHLSKLIENPAKGYEMLHHEISEYPLESQITDQIFSAYQAMRFEHQANYAAYKLERTTDRPLSILKWPAAVLQERAQAGATFCLILSLGCSLTIVVGHFFHFEFSSSPTLPIAIIVLLVLNVAARAVQDGLAAPEEVQRYSDYAGKIEYLNRRFIANDSREERLRVMIEMERAALEELIGFLRAHFEAKFIL